MTAQILLVLAVVAVGVLHTMVPDHWAPIALIARQHGWTRSQTARAALGAGTGHVVSTLVIGLAVWLAGVAFATKFANVVSVVSSVALIGFGLWIAIGSLLELRREHGHGDEHEHGHTHEHGDAHGLEHEPEYAHAGSKHRHTHRHEGGPVHTHLHAHGVDSVHEIGPDVETAPSLHVHEHKTSGRTALLLILGSSPMVEGIPAFFAASKYGVGLIAVMSIMFALSTIATYVALCVYSAERLQDVSIGPLEQYGEVLSGGFIALVGVAFLIWPIL
jgi:ABC-type nickel/cobalt efflux system permease component RcnA